MKQVKQLAKTGVLVILAAVLLIWVAALAKCEYLSIRYGDQFGSLYLEHTMFRTPKYIKVLRYTNTEAKVYYVSPKLGGDIVYYKRSASTSAWEFVKWETVWSGSGSADGFVWPYWMWGRLA